MIFLLWVRGGGSVGVVVLDMPYYGLMNLNDVPRNHLSISETYLHSAHYATTVDFWNLIFIGESLFNVFKQYNFQPYVMETKLIIDRQSMYH